MIRYGINHLDKYCAVVNDLNVFPVPDGDTGTNMVMTMKNGYQAIDGSAAELSAVARSFANATVFGARGNSGVIVSQFFKGVSKGLSDVDEADCSALSRALDMGCEYAYAAVAEPVEGTILTVIKDAADAVRARLSDIDAVDELIRDLVFELKQQNALSDEIADRLVDRAKVPVITVVNFNNPAEVKEKVMGYIQSLEETK